MLTQICIIKEGVSCVDAFRHTEVISLVKGITPCLGFGFILQLKLTLLLCSCCSPRSHISEFQ